MGKKRDLLLSILGGTAVVGSVVGLGYLGALELERLEAEYDDLRRRRKRLERRRLGNLSLSDLRELRRIEARMDEIEDAFGL
jgi:hypothetical protein